MAGPDEAARHYELALELASDTGMDDLDVVELTARACEAALAAGQTYRALALARDQLRATSPDTYAARPAAAAAGQGVGRDRRRRRGRPAEGHHRGAGAARGAPGRPAAGPDPRAARARALGAAPARRGHRGRDRGARPGRLARARRRRRRRPHHAGPAARAAPARPPTSHAMLEETVAQARAAGDLPTELRGMFNPRHRCSTRSATSPARATTTRGRQRGPARSGRPWAPYGLEARVLAIQAAHAAGRLGRRRSRSPTSAASHRRRLAEAMVRASALLVSAGRGDLSALELVPSAAPDRRARGHGRAVRRPRGPRPAR